MKRLKTELNALVNRGVDRHLRLAVTGLSRSGKTAFITALVNQLLNIHTGARLPLLSAAREERLLGVKRVPQRDFGIPRFTYDEGLAQLYGQPPMWPTPTRGVSEIRLALRYRSNDSLLRHFKDTSTLYLEIVDYPGEWLLDLPMLAQDLGPLSPLHRQHTHFSELARECQLFVAIGGLPLRNAQVNGGGANDHMLQYWLDKMQANGTRFINISPVRNDLSAVPDAEWLAIRPGTDTALLLALSYVLIAESLYDQAFVASHTVGFAPYRAYLLGEHDGVAKTPAWAAAITGLDAQRIADLAREMARHRTMVNISWSIQRARQGEQAYWATVALTALLGQLGTPGGGLGFGYACTNLAGAVRKAFSGPRLPAGENAVDSVIPVARLSDMLLHPGETYEFDGQQRRYPDIRLVYWAGGNVFHHHQDINRLCEAWRRPETVVVHEQYWTAQAKFSDIVLPATTSLEREDIGSGGHDGFMIAMSAQIPPVAKRVTITPFSAISPIGWDSEKRSAKGVTPGSGYVISMRSQDRGRRRRVLRCPRSMTSGSKGCWNTARRSGRKFFSPIFAPIRSAIRSPPPPAKLNSFPPPSPGLAIANALAIRGGMNRRPPGSDRRRRGGRFICSPASRAPACTVSTTTAASAGRRKFRDASRCGCIRAMRRQGISAKAAW